MSTKADELIRRGDAIAAVTLGCGKYVTDSLSETINAIPAATPALTGGQMERVRATLDEAMAAELRRHATDGPAFDVINHCRLRIFIALDKLVADERTLTERKG